MVSKMLHRASILAIATTSRYIGHSSTYYAAAFTPSIIATTTQQTRSYAYQSTTSLYSTPPTRYLLTYDYIPDVLEKRGPYRERHIGLAKEMIEEGTCVSGGPTVSPGESVPKGALFVFTTKDAAEKFVKEDPYVEGGIVTDHKIDEWSVVVGTN